MKGKALLLFSFLFLLALPVVLAQEVRTKEMKNLTQQDLMDFNRTTSTGFIDAWNNITTSMPIGTCNILGTSSTVPACINGGPATGTVEMVSTATFGMPYSFHVAKNGGTDGYAAWTFSAATARMSLICRDTFIGSFNSENIGAEVGGASPFHYMTTSNTGTYSVCNTGGTCSGASIGIKITNNSANWNLIDIDTTIPMVAVKNWTAQGQDIGTTTSVTRLGFQMQRASSESFCIGYMFKTNLGLNTSANFVEWPKPTAFSSASSSFVIGYYGSNTGVSINMSCDNGATWTGTTSNASSLTCPSAQTTTQPRIGFTFTSAQGNVTGYTITTPAVTNPNITITAKHIINSSTILSYSVGFIGQTNTRFTTTNGSISPQNITNGMYNLTFYAETEYGGFYNTTYLNVNISGQSFQANLSPYFYLTSAAFSNYINYSASNYTRNLTYVVNLSCPSFFNSYLDRYINGSVETSTAITCTNQSQLINQSYQRSLEGNYSIKIFFNNSYLPNQNNRQLLNGTFVSDLNSPSVAYLNFSFINGFYNTGTNISLTCNDSIAPILTYNLSFNGVQYRYENQSTGTNIKNDTNFIDGSNILNGKCQDFFSSSSLSRNISMYFATLYLIDEKDNTLFNLANVTGARAYFDDNSTYYDFKSTNTNAVNFTSNTNNKIRFELVYSNGDIITRYIDVALIDNDIRVCANKEGVNHYQQLLISSTQQVAVMKSIFSQCYVAADYTRFAYQDALTLQAFTIATQYYLYTYDEGNQILLASVDGSIANIINLDVLQFNRQAFSINILEDAMVFAAPLDASGERINDSIIIYYLNLKGDNTAATLDITRMDTGASVFSTSSFTSPNNFTLYFDYSTLANVSNTTIFRVDFTKTTASGIKSFTRYFNINADTGITKGSWAFAVAFLLTVFGLTLSVSRITFGWLGIVTNLASIFILATAVGSWYVNLLMMMNVIIFFYIGLVMWQQNYATLT